MQEFSEIRISLKERIVEMKILWKLRKKGEGNILHGDLSVIPFCMHDYYNFNFNDPYPRIGNKSRIKKAVIMGVHPVPPLVTYGERVKIMRVLLFKYV